MHTRFLQPQFTARIHPDRVQHYASTNRSICILRKYTIEYVTNQRWSDGLFYESPLWRYMFHKEIRIIALLPIIGISTIGCVASSDDEAILQPADTVQRTIIDIKADGTHVQTFETITIAQQQAEIDTRLALMEGSRSTPGVHSNIIALDASCAAADLWLFDQANLGGHQLCMFLRDESFAFLDLGSVLRLSPTGSIVTWSGAVRSLWAGVTPGNLTACTPTLCFAGPGDGFHFEPFQRFNSVAPGTHPLNNIGLFTD